jgi:hypothetical protein
VADGSGARPVDVYGDASRIGGRFDELEVHRSGQILEQRKPGAECGRLDHEPVLVDQPESRQRLVEGGAAVGDQVVPRFALETPDLFGDLAAGDARVSGQSAYCRVFEKTTFGISFIGRAYSLVDVGQTAAISS